jgi:hypothetical protein
MVPAVAEQPRPGALHWRAPNMPGSPGSGHPRGRQEPARQRPAPAAGSLYARPLAPSPVVVVGHHQVELDCEEEEGALQGFGRLALMIGDANVRPTPPGARDRTRSGADAPM